MRGVDCIIIDYLGLISSATKKENRVQEVSEITRSLKMMAKDLNIPVAYNFPAGHIKDNRALILGATISFEVSKKETKVVFE